MATRWRPNTCGCELEFVLGPNLPPVHITRCPEHQHDVGLVVWDENRGLNRTLKVLQETRGIAPETVLWTFTPRAAPTGRRPLEIVVLRDVQGVSNQPDPQDLDPSDRAHVHLRSAPAASAAPHALTPGGKPV